MQPDKSMQKYRGPLTAFEPAVRDSRSQHVSIFKWSHTRGTGNSSSISGKDFAAKMEIRRPDGNQ
jgi:hypothetical protein